MKNIRSDILSVSINLNRTHMDGDSYSKNKKVSNLDRDRCVNVGNILQPTRVRCSICVCNEIDRFLLDYGCNFLPYISFIIYSLLLLEEAF